MSSAVVMAYGDIGSRCIKTLMEYNIKIKSVVTREEPSYGGWFNNIVDESSLYNISVCNYATHKNESLIDKVATISPDYLFIINFPEALPIELFSMVRVSSYHLHFSLLPYYKGHHPIQWSIINGEKQTGVTLSITTGKTNEFNIINQIPIPILSHDTSSDIEKKLTVSGEIILFQTMPNILKNSVVSQPLTKDYGSHFRPLVTKDRQFHWHWNALRIHNLIRAFAPPHAGAFFDLENRLFWVYQSRLTNQYGRPGNYVYSDSRLIMFAGDGRGIEIISLAYDEGILPIEEWVCTYPNQCLFEI
ncbi:formyltransferase family protein [Candidatus Ichthyocystis hellenicum]|uniref:formyltransferase family protein n=1 Tax=Candidatus Ichthyocystis hellenicum TaxID=1561003 RepID=UPI000B848AFE|nr:formyltransferase family protein [Candidatus Ichthyocystis hellenicum]